MTGDGAAGFFLAVNKPMMWTGGVLLGSAALALAEGDTTAELRKELDALRGDYEKRIDRVERRLAG